MKNTKISKFTLFNGTIFALSLLSYQIYYLFFSGVEPKTQGYTLDLIAGMIITVGVAIVLIILNFLFSRKKTKNKIVLFLPFLIVVAMFAVFIVLTIIKGIFFN